MASLLQAAPARASLVPAPSPGGPLGGDYTRAALPDHARRSLLQWTIATARQLGLQPDVRIEAPTPDVSLVHHRSDERDLFFLANASRSQAADLVAHFPTGTKRPWLWDPEKGSRAPLPAAKVNPGTLALHLEPLQSLLIVFEPGSPADDAVAAAPLLRRGRDELPIVAAWEVDLRPAVGAPFHRTLSQLFDLSLAAGDPELRSFGGAATYRCSFEWSDTSLTLLSLGAVHGTSAVRLNGKDLGLRWYGRHLYDTAGALVKGRNLLEVEVTTTLGNFMRARESDAAAKRWAWWFPPVAAGLVGPVQLMKPASP